MVSAAQVRLGQILRLAREKRGESLKQAAQFLRIPEYRLESLEQGDMSGFKAEVYARGAYMRYAQYLEVDRKVDIQALTRTLSDAKEWRPLKVPTPAQWWERWLTPKWLFVLVLVLAGSVGGSYVGWQVQSFLRLPELFVYEPMKVVVDSDKVVIKGVAELGASVKINEEPVLLSENGSFSLDLLLHPGVNVVRVEAINAAGRANVVRRDLLLPRT